MKRRKISETNYWQSYSDMMAALLLIFLLVIAIAFVKLWRQQENLKQQEQELTKQEEQLEEQRELLEKQGTEYLSLNNKLLEAQEQLKKIVGIQSEIIESLNKELKEENIDITLDPKTGALRLEAEILFETNRSELLESGQQYLAQFLPVYFEVLFREEYQEFISEIIVEGNCDSRGSYENNLILSQERARTVALFCKDLMGQKWSGRPEQLEELLRLLNINGRSNKNVIYDENQQENMDASRRVEIKFRLKDDEMMEEMEKILGGEQ